MDGGPSGATTTARTLLVLQQLTNAAHPLSVPEIASATGMATAEVHRVLGELRQFGFAVQDPATGRYRTGHAAVGLGQEARRRDALRTAGTPVIARLAALTGETTTLSARQGYERCYVGQVESMQEIRISVTLGERVSLVVGANGIVILAALPDEDVEQVLRLPRPRLTSSTITDEQVIRERVAVARERGWARSDGERVKHSASIAAAVLDRDGRPAGSLSVAYLAERADDATIAQLAEVVVEAAAEASARLRDLDA
ncbi:IclR family transcriptional regulator [Cellulosimicrobium sp. CUA-896]|uniref:IclR family transcriptional regulator n=1 Tax=Cellulosimicrobium sp. CUA-896 TaxID=1517881 RepID=UPI00095D50D4|nr:IclR family transcriptional regulator [Cellulosimicrobium sp. CUA-896]OLT54544.1 hypothetical protein BJF88_08425 [Cellulosimicrobium sp. CUA-896]